MGHVRDVRDLPPDRPDMAKQFFFQQLGRGRRRQPQFSHDGGRGDPARRQGQGREAKRWSDDIFWEDIQHTVVYPIVSWFRWAFQVVEQSVASEPASSADTGFQFFEVDPDTGRVIIKVTGTPSRRHPPGIDPDHKKDRKYVWWGVPGKIKGKNNKEYDADSWCAGYPGGRTNCHGTSVAGGQVWIQPSDFLPILNDVFQTTTDLKEGNLVVWFDGQLPIHSAILTSVGSGINDSLTTGMLGARDYVETTTILELNKIYRDDSPVMYEPK